MAARWSAVARAVAALSLVFTGVAVTLGNCCAWALRSIAERDKLLARMGKIFIGLLTFEKQWQIK